MKKMFCFQCEQTARGNACTYVSGMCGKTAELSRLQDELLSSLIGLAVNVSESDKEIGLYTDNLILEGLYTTATGVCFDPARIRFLTSSIREENLKLSSRYPMYNKAYSKFFAMDISSIWYGDINERSLKSMILFGLKGMASYAYQAKELGYSDRAVTDFIYRALTAVATESNLEKLMRIAMDTGKMNYRCMGLLDTANAELYGIPDAVELRKTIEKGPFIIVSGNNLHDLEELLKQTSGKEISVYTHGDMLPAHGYPQFRKYPHLKGHYGTSWHNQQKEFNAIPGVILFTGACLMPPRESYSDRVFTTGAVYWPSAPHIDDRKDFSPVIEKAIQLGGYSYDVFFAGVNGGRSITTGYSYRMLNSYISRIAAKLKTGEIRRIFFVGGCDGAKTGRNYYTEFVSSCPPDSIILTIGCGKYRFNDLNLGSIDGIPRLIDLGQCSDIYGTVQLLRALAIELGCSISELPLSIALSWYEQKTTAILLTLLYLGAGGIIIGPSIPAFISPRIWLLLSEVYGIRLIGSPKSDIEEELSK